MSETSSQRSSERLSGNCLCGGVSYVIEAPAVTPVEAPARAVWNCHCHRCRRFTGHFMAATWCEHEDLRFTSDSTLTWFYPDDDPNVAYGFCRKCGGSLFWRVVEAPPDAGVGARCTWVCAGSLNGPTGMQTERVVYASEFGDYNARAPHFEERAIE